MESKTFTVGGRELKVMVLHASGRDRRELNKKATASVSNEADKLDECGALAGLAKIAGAPSVFTKRGEYPLVDKGWDAINAHIVETKSKDLRLALDQLGAKDATFKFSRKAGCPCGCSPGFLLSGLGYGKTYYVEGKAAATMTGDVAESAEVKHWGIEA